MKLNLYSAKGKKLNKKVKLDDIVFDAKVNEPLMAHAVYIYLANQRQQIAHTKTRAEVRGGGVKPWAQKGTGRARHGSIRSPIWKGGGVVFGPRKERNYSKKMPKKMKRAAIRSAFSSFAKNKKVIILEGVDFKKDHLTKQLVIFTEKLPVAGKVLYIQSGEEKMLYLASRNLKKVNVIPVNEVNVYTLLNHDYVVFLQDSLGKISKFWGEKKGVKPKTMRGKQKVVKVEEEEKSLEDLGLSKRLINVLKKQGITTKKQLYDIVQNEEKVGNIKGIGEKSLIEIKRALNIK